MNLSRLLALFLLIPGIAFGQARVSTAPAQYGQVGLNLLIGQPPYYVANYGARCNIAAITGLSITGGTNVLSSSAHTFVQTDVGKLINIIGANAYTVSGNTHTNTTVDSLPTTPVRHVGDPISGTGLTAGTTIGGILSSTSVAVTPAATGTGSGVTLTISPAATYSISSVSGGNAVLSGSPSATISSGTGTWGTDDTSAFQAAVNAASTGGGGTLVMPNGRCGISGTIQWANEVSMYGQGYGPGQSSLVWISTSDMDLGMIYSNNTVTSCSVAQAALFSDSSFHDFEIDASLARQDSGYNVSGKGIQFACSTRVKVFHIYAHDTPATAIATDLAIDADTSHNLIWNSGRLSSGGLGGNGIGSEAGPTLGNNFTIIGNEIHCSKSYGILIGNNGTTVTDALPIVISGNNIYGCNNSDLSQAAGGISVSSIGASVTGNAVQGDGTSSLFWQGIAVGPSDLAVEPSGTETVITGNSVYQAHIGIGWRYDTYTPGPNTIPAAPLICGNRVAHNSFGILVAANASVVMNVVKICNNEVDHNTLEGIGFIGAGGFTSVDIDGNQIWDNGFSASGAARAGIYINAAITNLNVRGNTAFDDGANVQAYGLSIDTGNTVSANNITSNDFARNTVAATNVVGTLTGSSTSFSAAGSGATILGSATSTPQVPILTASLPICTDASKNLTSTCPTGSGSGAEQTISFQPGLLTAVTNTKGVFGKFVKASTVDNIIASAINFTCVGNPTITLYECGTDANCATSPVSIGTATVTAAGVAVTGTVSTPAITAGDFIAWAISAGTCTSIDISATAQVHAN